MKNYFEETEDNNRVVVEEILDGESLTVAVTEDGTFYIFCFRFISVIFFISPRDMLTRKCF